MSQDREPDLLGSLLMIILSSTVFMIMVVLICIALVRTDNYIPTIQEEQKTEETEDVDGERLPIEAYDFSGQNLTDLEFAKRATA